MKFSIGVKLTSVFLLTLLVVVSFGAYSLDTNQRALRQAVGQSSVFLAEDTMERINKDIFLRIEEIQLYSRDALIQSSLRESNQIFEGLDNREEYIRTRDLEWVAAGDGEVTPFMRELTENDTSSALRREFVGFWERKYGYRIYGEVFITNKYGANIAQTDKTSDYWQADEEWWQIAKNEGFSVSGIEYDESAMVWSMPISVRIDDAQGNFLGIIKTVPLVEEMVREAELTTKKYETTKVNLLTKNGRLIYSTETFKFFEDMSKKEFFKNIASENGFFISKEGGREKLLAYAHSTGFRNFEGFNWILVISHDTAEVFSAIQRLRNTFLVMSLALFIAFAFLAFLLVRSISLPIKKLTEGANYIAQGNLNIKIKIASKDELGQLADSFNKMTEKLRRSYQNLEGKVKLRTQELEKNIKELDATAKLLVRRDLELLNLNDRLQEIDRAKSHFVSIAAHQLRTPLSIIKWTFRMLLSGDFGKLNDEQKSVIQRGYDINEGTIKLISDLLDVARMETGRFLYNFSDVSIEKIVKEVVKMNEPSAEEKKIKLVIVNNFKGNAALVWGDENALRIALQNFISNALNYTLPGGKVEVIYKKEGKFIEVRVTDTGVGIPKGQMSRLFTKFFRGDNVVRMQTSGTGLGLFIVESIISAHKGYIGVESQEGKGSTFWFRIPIK